MTSSSTKRSSRGRLTPEIVTDAALAEVDEHGPTALTMASVAARTGVSAPSLYKHISGLAELQASVAVRVLTEMTEALTSAALGRSGADALGALMHAYRDYSVSHPHRYAAVPADPLSSPLTAEAARRQLAVVLAVLHGCGIEGSDAVHVTRGLRSMVHGFAHIESSGGFGMSEDVNESFQRMVDGFLSSMPRISPPTKEKQ